MSKLNLADLLEVSASAAEVLKAIAGNSDAAHPNDPAAMVRLWDDLNDRHAPPAVVKAMADELINLRQHNEKLHAQRIADRRRFSNPASAELVAQAVTDASHTLQNWQTTADLLRHLADNEIDSDSFAVTHENENGKETECELIITEFALRAAGDIDALLDALAQRDAQIAALTAENGIKQEFIVTCFRSAASGADLDGADIQELGERLGLFARETYQPVLHGYICGHEAGEDNVYVLKDSPATDSAANALRVEGVLKAARHIEHKFPYMAVPVTSLEWLAVEMRKGNNND